MAITVYTTAVCPQCRATKRKLDSLGIPYNTVNIDNDNEAREYVTSLGYFQAPVVINGEDHWSGFRPDRLDSLKR